MSREKRKDGRNNAAAKSEKNSREESGFDRNLKAERIVGVALDSENKIRFLIKWAGRDEAELVLADTAYEKIPQMVIQFYESRLIWS